MASSPRCTAGGDAATLKETNRKKATMNARTFPGPAWLALAAVLAVGAAACGSGNVDKAVGPVTKPVVLTLADGETDYSNAQPFANAVSRLSHGMLQIKIESSWRFNDPNDETDLIKDVQTGKAALGITASRAFDTMGIDSFQALQTPFLIDSVALERKVLASAIPGQMLAGLKPAGLVGLGVLPGPLRRPLGFTKPLLAASSYRGARIAIRPSHVTADIFRALGAIPVTHKGPRSDPSIAGLTGIEMHAVSIDAGFATPGAVLTGNVVFEPRPSVIFINQSAFGSLSASQRNILDRAATQARAAGIYQGNDTAAVADLCRRGIKIVSASPADLAGLRVAVQPVYRTLESNPATRAFITEITAMRQAIGGSPSTVACPAAGTTGGVTGAATVLQGTWQVTYTESELVAAGADASELSPGLGNWGQFTLTFRQGHWQQRLLGGDPGVAPNNRLPMYGTYVVTGHQITFYRHDHNYTGSDTEIWGPYTWSVYRDMLTLRGHQGPTGLTVRPWRKTGL
jgi:TRAP-type C4-dicarboxylate transport system substrate-binding protein